MKNTTYNFFQPIQRYFHEKIKLLSGLNTNKAVRMDEVPIKFLRQVPDALAYPLSRIINLFAEISVFSDACNYA